MSAASKRPKQPLLSGHAAFRHPLLLLFFFALSILSLYFLFFASSFHSTIKNTAPLLILPRSEEIPSHGIRNGSSRTEPRLLHLPRSPKEPGLYHDWDQFASDFEEMMRSFKIFVYPDALNASSASPFSNIFLPHPDPSNPKLGNYFSEHMFKVSLLQSSLVTTNPEEAHFFFMPFSVNNMRNDPRVRAEGSISKFVAEYTERISREFEFWNASLRADHFYVHCHSVGREAASEHRALLNNAIQVTCSSSYFQRLYVSHKDVGLPQVWPRPSLEVLTPPSERFEIIANRLSILPFI